jgi:hypothetical protein
MRAGIGGALACLMCLPAGLAAQTDDPARLEFFEKRIRPVLAEHCYKCHSAEAKQPKGGLLLDRPGGLLKGGDSGPALVSGKPDQSRFIEAIRYQNVDLRMPPKGKLPAAAIADLVKWVELGAPWPAQAGPTAAAKQEDFDLQKRKRQHWAWRPIRPQDPPHVNNSSWPRSPIDRFILAKLEARGLAPAAAADRRTLLRRVYFDLIGLPPTPEQIDAFLHDQAAAAFDKVVDGLLASPHFGERWARHWLDLVRYAETRGHEFDFAAPNAYQYRDYVIRAFNADVPYNLFVTEHLAGDLLDRPRLHPTAGFDESILGTGFWFLGEWVHSPVDIRQDEADRLDNMIDVAMKTFQGLTVGCARCHDHKFDAISTRDYYALAGFLQSASYRLARFDSLDHNRRLARELEIMRARQRPPLQHAMADVLRPGVNRLADYLLAAQDHRRGRSPEEIAQSRHLQSSVLRHWVTHLQQAVKDDSDPFHAWAKLAAPAHSNDDRDAGPAENILKPMLAGWRKQLAAADAARAACDVVVDYATSTARDWLQDGCAFGVGPVRPGDVRFGGDRSWPIVKVFDYAAAEKDATWDRLKLAAGAETEPGTVSQVERPGRMLRTPTFRIGPGKLFYLVKGTGHAYAAVDSHNLIDGPLHGQLVMPIKTGDSFQWVSHDLSPYQGQRVHVEFTPARGADFAVAMVVQAATSPPSPHRPNHALAEALSGKATLDSVAAAYQRLLAEAVERLGSDRIAGSRDAADYAALADWIVHHPELFGADSQEAKNSVRDAATPLLARQAGLVAQIKEESRLAMAMMDSNAQDENVFIRGSHKKPGERVPRRFLEALAGREPLADTRGSGRLELARQMTDPAANPFIRRVLVNRVWHHLFGRGIVASVDNFGVMGELPTHPELLDYLADRFVQQGWSIKALIRALVLSSAYQMSSQSQPGADQADPQNLLLHCMRLRRLEGEAIRDAMLAVTGRLNPRLYGPSVPVHLTQFLEGRGRPATGPVDGDGRRSVYIAVRRNFLSPFLLAFDTPIPFSSVGRRTVSNVPAQALILLNDPFVHQQAELWGRAMLACTASADERIGRMYQTAFGRPPTSEERAACVEFVNRQGSLSQKGSDPLWLSRGLTPFGIGSKINRSQSNDAAAWADLAHVLFNVKEFIFIK